MNILQSLTLAAALYPVFLAPICFASRRGWLPALTEGKEDA